MARSKARLVAKSRSSRNFASGSGRPPADGPVQVCPGPSRFGPEAAVVAWPADAGRSVPPRALAVLAQGFPAAGDLGAAPTVLDAASVVVKRLAQLLLPGALLVDSDAARREHAFGIHTWDERAARLILSVSLGIVREACAGKTPVIPIERLKPLTPDMDELPEQTVLRNAALELGVFTHRLDLSNGSKLLIVGSGSRQRRILGLLPDGTTFSGALATNKNVACTLLARAGLPVPVGETVTSRAEAHAVAKKLGYPVTLKVATGSRQRGVVPCVVSARALERALDRFCSRGRVAVELRLERYVDGTYFRAFVAAGELVACASSPSPTVTGDGKRTIRALVAEKHRWLEAVLADGERDLAENARNIFEQVLVGYDLAPEDVLDKGRTVPVAFPTSEGFAFDVTHKVHPANAAALVRATRVLGMFWSGIDVQAQRIERPFADQDAVIIEVNDIPAWAFHACPLAGEGPGVAMPPAIFKAFFGTRRPDVPVAVVVDDARAAAELARKLSKKGVRAVVVSDALEGALDPEADAIVVATTAKVLHEEGLSVPSADVVLGAVPATLEPVVAHLVERAKGARARSVKSALARMLALA